jgi:hypothetical protein
VAIADAHFQEEVVRADLDSLTEKAEDRGMERKDGGGFWDLASGLTVIWMVGTGLVGALAIGYSGVKRLLDDPGSAAIRQAQAEIAEWPDAPGTIHELRVVEQSTGRAHGSLYSPVVKYRYSVDGKQYMGSRLSFSWNTYAADNLKGFENRIRKVIPSFDAARFRNDPACAQLAAFQSCSVVFAVEQPIRVHYDPNDPAQAIVDNTDIEPVSFMRRHTGALISTLMGIVAVVFLAGMVRSVRRRLAGEAADRAPVERALDAMGDDPKRFRYVPFPLSAQIGTRAMGLSLLLLSVAYFETQYEWRVANDGSDTTFWLVGLLVLLPIGVFGSIMLLMPGTTTRLDFVRKRVVVTQWFLSVIPWRESRSFAEFESVELRVVRPTDKWNQPDARRVRTSIVFAERFAGEAVEVFASERWADEAVTDHPTDILELARQIARAAGLECHIQPRFR